MLLIGDVAIRAARKHVSEFRPRPNQIERYAPGVRTMEGIQPWKRFLGVSSAGCADIRACNDILHKDHP